MGKRGRRNGQNQKHKGKPMPQLQTPRPASTVEVAQLNVSINLKWNLIQVDHRNPDRFNSFYSLPEIQSWIKVVGNDCAVDNFLKHSIMKFNSKESYKFLKILFKKGIKPTENTLEIAKKSVKFKNKQANQRIYDLLHKKLKECNIVPKTIKPESRPIVPQTSEKPQSYLQAFLNG